jgi:hypothetical protein
VPSPFHNYRSLYNYMQCKYYIVSNLKIDVGLYKKVDRISLNYNCLKSIVEKFNSFVCKLVTITRIFVGKLIFTHFIS